jgi:hypothetical protein
MNLRLILILCTSLLFSACIRTPEIKGEGYAFIRSNYPIVHVNDETVEPMYQLDIKAGENTLVIVYNTYQSDYFCTFNWIAEAGVIYEVTDQENQYPLTLYRWYKTSSLFASRLDPVDPIKCDVQQRR